MKTGTQMLRLLICAGGTGGGIYPAIAVLEAMDQKNMEVLWVGSQNGLDANLIHNASSVSFKEIPSAGLHGVGLRSLPANLLKLAKGFVASKRILKDFRPDVIFFTGGYITVPMAFAAARIPKVVFVPDTEPGLALKVITRKADKIALSVPASKQYFKDQSKLVVCGYPTRSDFISVKREDAVRVFHISEHRPVLLVFGGSRGAHSINHALLGILPDLTEIAQVIHITGDLDWPMVSSYYEGLSADVRKNYYPYPYLHENMANALRAADLVVSRSGASIMGEYPMLGLPAILVPYPYAWRYQKQNADYLVEQGGAILLADEDLSVELAGTIQDLLKNPQRLAEMSEKMKQLARPQAAAEIARIIASVSKTGEKQQ
jgi:undecaprenyldiphospho-muramoylpentapeptide beta-N-acetylglucosaminyltransferase